MDENGFKQLNHSIEELITLCEKLKRENHTLKQSFAHKQDLYQTLLDKNQRAQAKVESLLIKLKTEQG